MIETLPSSFSRAIRSRIIAALLGAHRRERLVEQQDVGVAGDRARDRDRLTLTAGQPRDRHVEPRDVDPDLVERLARLTAHQHGWRGTGSA